MKLIIPAAGEGARLRPHTHTTPKTLVQVAGKPILGHILDKMVNLPISDLILIVGYMGKKIKEYVESNYNFKTTYLEQKNRLGLGYAINLASGVVNGEPLLINLDDTILDLNIEKMTNSGYSSIAVKEVANPKRFGVVEMSNGFVKRLIEKPEKPPTNFAIAGLYYIQNSKLLFECLEELIRKDIKTHGEYQLTDGLQNMVEKGEKLCYIPVEKWYDCGKPETLLATNREILAQNSKTYDIPGANSVIIPPVFISQSASISNSIIGPYVSIASGARVSDSIIKDTIINENAKVKNVLLCQSLIGENAVVNGKFDKLNVGDSSEIDFS